jgi:hypothetical protein
MEMEESFLVIYKVFLKALWQVRHAHCPTGSLYDCVGLNLFTVAEDKNSLHLLGIPFPLELVSSLVIISAVYVSKVALAGLMIPFSKH